MNIAGADKKQLQMFNTVLLTFGPSHARWMRFASLRLAFVTTSSIYLAIPYKVLTVYLKMKFSEIYTSFHFGLFFFIFPQIQMSFECHYPGDN
jgi:hypothetical protein